MRPVRHSGNSGNSGNSAHYRNGYEPPYHLVEVVRVDHSYSKSTAGQFVATRLRTPRFRVKVHEWKTGGAGSQLVAEFTYEPKTRPRTYYLPDDVVNLLLKEHGL